MRITTLWSRKKSYWVKQNRDVPFLPYSRVRYPHLNVMTEDGRHAALLLSDGLPPRNLRVSTGSEWKSSNLVRTGGWHPAGGAFIADYIDVKIGSLHGWVTDGGWLNGTWNDIEIYNMDWRRRGGNHNEACWRVYWSIINSRWEAEAYRSYGWGGFHHWYGSSDPDDPEGTYTAWYCYASTPYYSCSESPNPTFQVRWSGATWP